MDPTHLFLLLSLSILTSFIPHGAAQPPTQQANASPPAAAKPYRPRTAVVIGIFSVMISVTFLLVVYAKLCHYARRADSSGGGDPRDGGGGGGRLHLVEHLVEPPRSSGVDRIVVESLPFFRFSELKGSRDGLECAVCLSRFDGHELLRLLPRCRHAFHLACVDRWLDDHSSCPLCRQRVLVEDLTLFRYSTSSRFLFPDAPPLGDAGLELYVEREPAGGDDDDDDGEARSSTSGSSCSFKKGALPPAGVSRRRGDQDRFFPHRFQHRIIVSDVVYKNRWSDLNSSDLVSLNSEMLRSHSGRRFPATSGDQKSVTSSCCSPEHCSSADETIRRIKAEMDRKRSLEDKASQMNGAAAVPGAAVPPPQASAAAVPPKMLSPSAGGGSRAMSEILNVSRFADGAGGRRPAAANKEYGSRKDEMVRRVWLPIARRTVRWFAGRENRSEIDDGDRRREESHLRDKILRDSIRKTEILARIN